MSECVGGWVGGWVCVYMCVRGTGSQRSVQRVRNHLNRGLCSNTYELHHCVCHETLFLSLA